MDRFNRFLVKHLGNSLYFAVPVTLACSLIFSIGYLIFYKTEIFWLDALGTFFSVLVLASAYNFILKRHHLHLYWIMFLLFFSFNGFYLVIDAPHSTTNASGLMLVLMILTITLNNGVLLCLFLIAGILLACLVYNFTVAPIILTLHFAETWIVYLLGLIWGLVLSHKKLLLEKKREGMLLLMQQLAHELNTPLMSIKMGCLSLQKFIPLLIQGYKLAQEKKLPIQQVISVSALESLTPIAQDMSEECTAVGRMVKIMVMNAQDVEYYRYQHTTLSMYHCIEQALKRYPYPETFDHQHRIHWDKTEDFSFHGVEILMEHVFLNLIKNAVYAILKADKGDIYINNTVDKQFNYLHFKDTGCGIKPENVRNLFKSFFTTKQAEGTGLGLYFCKTVTENFGGKITCESIEGQETVFTLKLPKIKPSL